MKDVTLITGASSGIGLELARIAAEDGRNLALTARTLPRLDKLASQLRKYGIEVKTYKCDLSEIGQAIGLVETIRKDKLEITQVINNAGVGSYGLFTESDWINQLAMINLNIISLTYISKAFVPDMIKAGKGRVMNVASTAAFVPGPYMAVYYASKAYVLSLTEALGEELKKTGVTATALCPGPTQSSFATTAGIENSARLFKGSLPTSYAVAKYGYANMLSGKRVAIHGLKNRFAIAFLRLLPRRLVSSAAARASEPGS